MARVWVLDTETKGTGAEVVPLERVLREAAPRAPYVFVPREGRPAQEPLPRSPWRFKVVDVMTREVLADSADTRATVDLLKGIRSIVDVLVYVWEQPAGRWRLLTHRDRSLLWELRGR